MEIACIGILKEKTKTKEKICHVQGTSQRLTQNLFQITHFQSSFKSTL